MAIPTSKPLNLSTVQTEYGGTNPISMSEYRGKGNAPATGPIDLWGDFNGTAAGSSIEIRVYGAAGGDRSSLAGGHGGYTQFTATVVSGTVFSLYAGGAGDGATSYEGGGGGAASYVTVGSTLIAVAGGGGGAASLAHGGSGGGSNNAGGNASTGSTGGSGGSGGTADNNNARYSAGDGYAWSASGFLAGRGGQGGEPSGAGFSPQPGLNPGGKGYGGYGGNASDFSDEGGGGGGGGYGGGGGGCTSDSLGQGESGAGGGGYRRTTDLTGVTGVGGGGSNGSNGGHGYIQVYNGGSLVTTVTATSYSGASGSYTVP